jgi:hypothetical protein
VRSVTVPVTEVRGRTGVDAEKREQLIARAAWYFATYFDEPRPNRDLLEKAKAALDRALRT